MLDPPGTPLQVFGPDGRPFVTVEELSHQRQEAEDAALVERLQRELAEERATQVRQQLLQERQQREQAEARAQEAKRQIQEMRRQMREAGLLPEGDE